MIHDVEQGSPEWRALRVGRPCASEFSKVVTSNGQPSKSAAGYAITLAAELFAGKSIDAWEGNQWTERGKELEAEAIMFYEFVRDLTVNRVGFVTDADQYGCSPDGFIGDDGLLEIKSLKAENHVRAILHFQKYGYCSSDYVMQPQGQLMITGRKWVDLLFYHPDLPPLIIRLEAVPDLHAALRAELPKVIAERDRVLEALRKAE